MRLLPAALPIVFLPAAFAQTAALRPAAVHSAPARDAAARSGGSASLPVTSVSLYKNGVGFFEHTGHVTGDAKVTIDFTSSQLNDVLQSLTAIDLNGGRISGASFNSTTPLEQQLRTLSLGLGENTTFSSFLTAVRGSRVEVRGSGAPFTGRIMDIETHDTAPGKEGGGMKKTRFLSVISDAGELRIFAMTPALSVRLADSPTREDVSKYLELLNSTRSDGLRHLTLEDRGAGAREIRVSYISEVPVWKSTYRFLLTNPGSSAGSNATLQGWSVVDNTTGVDWINVRLSLIAGAPQSFVQPLSQPIYSRRPEIPIVQEAQLTPQTFDSSMEAVPAPPPPPVLQGNMADSVTVSASPRSIGGPLEMRNRSTNGLLSRGYGSGVGVGIAGGFGSAPVMAYEDAARESIAPNTKAAGFDDFFAYTMSDPVTILKNQSAMVPILQAKVPADSVTLVSYIGGQAAQPLRALWIHNTTDLTLDRGSFSIVENGQFGGEGLLEPVHPGEKRLLSYAADQALHAATEGDKLSNHLTLIRGSHGTINLHHADRHEVTLVLHNAAPVARTVVAEVPVVSGWKLDSERDSASSDPKPVETTPTVYRFRSEVAAGDTVRLHIGATRSSYNTFYLTNSNDNQITFILNQSGNNPALRAALQPVIDARRRVADAQKAVDDTNKRLEALRSDEDRQRANITALQNADRASRDRFVSELNKTEDAITAAQAQLATETDALNAAKAELANRIDSFSINEHVSES